MEAPHKVIVVGGGITGLTAAYRLVTDAKRAGVQLEVKLLDAAERTGGVIGTSRRDGFVMEEGPDCFISTKPEALEICRELGIEDQVIGTSPTHRRSFIVRRNRLLEVPKGFYLLAPDSFLSLARTPIFSAAGKARMACDVLIKRKADDKDESLESFVVRRLGREALDRMAQPMVAGIYTADPAKLSLKATFPQFLEWEQEYGSIIRALWIRKKEQASSASASGARYSLFLSLRKGLQTLTDKLKASLPEGCVQTGVSVNQVSREGKGWQLETNKHPMSADALCLAIPANLAGGLLNKVSPNLSSELTGIEYHGAITANMVFRREDVDHPLNGMGFVVPAVERKNIIACSFSSVKFEGRAPGEFALLRAYIGGPGQQSLLGRDDTFIADLVERDLHAILGLQAKPMQTHISYSKNVMPQYHIGHLDRVERIERQLAQVPGLALAGNAYRGVGIPDCIRSATAAAAALSAFLDGSRQSE
ncbi:MAG: protoporphyrinogen oxidase [Planctomycetota bacterium]|nr:protoporphyrinogen oxidase [Planctomycetota bacterium]MDA1140546.1 protoporphyrinogen oxidase [Planctomycetota bacterium]